MRYILFFLFCWSLTQAQSVEALLAQNPQLAEQYLKRQPTTSGIEQDTPVAKVPINVVTPAPYDSNMTEYDSNVTEYDSNATKKISTEVKEGKIAISSTPFDYQSNQELLEKALKAQLDSKQTTLHRFGTQFLQNNNGVDPSSMPVSDEYPLSVGDKVAISLFGMTNKKIVATINNNGDILFDNLGPLHVAGMKFGMFREKIKKHLEAAYVQTSAYVNIDTFSTIQITVSGQVAAPGIYNLRAYSTILDALRTVGGVSATGTLREIELKREGTTVEVFDLYDILRHGNSTSNAYLKHGDVIVVGSVKNEIYLFGAVQTPAIYELRENETLETLLEYAGGLSANALADGIRIKRFEANKQIVIKTLNREEIKGYPLQNGDTVYIRSLTDRDSLGISLLGNIVNPGPRALDRSTTLHKLLSQELETFGRMGLFLDDTEWHYGVIRRYNQNLNYELISFDLSKVISGESDIALMDHDEIYIFNKNALKQNPYIYVGGDALDEPRKVQYYENITLHDIYKSILFKTENIHQGIRHRVFPDLSHIKVVRQNASGEQTFILDLEHQGNFALQPFDELFFYDYYSLHAIETISIKGEVYEPTTQQYTPGITLQDLINAAGGLTQKAYLKKVEIVRYHLDENLTRQKEIVEMSIEDGAFERISLQPYDEVTIFKIPNWNDRKTVTLSGEVKFPGTYTISSGERLSSILQRAGGFTENAFVKGALFTRENVKVAQQKQMQIYAKRIKERAILQAGQAEQFGEVKSIKQNLVTFAEELSKEANSYTPIGRIALQLDEDITKIAGSPSDITLYDGDSLYIPTPIDTVYVFGEVFNPTTIIYDKQRSLEEYIELAGGMTENADASGIYVVKANGSAVKYKSCWFCTSNLLIERGDTIVVPMDLNFISSWQMIKDVSQVLYQIGLTAAAWHTITK